MMRGNILCCNYYNYFSLILIHDPSHSPKKPDASEKEIRLNEGRFERLLKILSSISKNLKSQLQRKTLLLGTEETVSSSAYSRMHGGFD